MGAAPVEVTASRDGGAAATGLPVAAAVLAQAQTRSTASGSGPILAVRAVACRSGVRVDMGVIALSTALRYRGPPCGVDDLTYTCTAS